MRWWACGKCSQFLALSEAMPSACPVCRDGVCVPWLPPDWDTSGTENVDEVDAVRRVDTENA
jgi:hypothetical protein